MLFTLAPTSEYSRAGRWLFIIGYVFVVKASLFFLMSGTSNLTKQLGDQANRARLFDEAFLHPLFICTCSVFCNSAFCILYSD